jgi:phosphopantothenoylcysteine synthetase/decarboxylase
MAEARREDVLYFIVCGGPPAGEAPTLVKFAQTAGWDVCLIATPQGRKFIDAGQLAELTGHPVRSDYKLPNELDVLPPANAIVVAPATFNTINKFASGIADTLPLSLLCEYLGLGVPIIVGPNVNPALARHPEYRSSLRKLQQWGVRVLHDPSASPPTWISPLGADWRAARSPVLNRSHEQAEGHRTASTRSGTRRD